MAECKYCGAEGLSWVRCDSGSGWDLMEPDGEYHGDNCNSARRIKHKERREQEEAGKKEAVRKHKEANGYL